MTEIKSKQCREWSGARFGELQDSSFASTPQHARDFAKTALVVCEIAEAEGRGDEIEARVGERQLQGVGGDKNGTALASATATLRAQVYSATLRTSFAGVKVAAMENPRLITALTAVISAQTINDMFILGYLPC